jgi:hypothetical protein
MAKKTSLSDTEKVAEYIQKLENPTKEMVETIRQIILNTDKELGEQIKWNSPSFYYTGEMKEFDPKEYKRDIAVMNLNKGNVMLIFPTGATIKDTTGILEGLFPDGRRLVKFKNLEDVRLKEKSLKKVVKEWLELVEK